MWKFKKESYCNRTKSTALRCFLWKSKITVSQHWNWKDLEIPQDLVNVCVLSVLPRECQTLGLLGVFTLHWAHFLTFITCNPVSDDRTFAPQMMKSICICVYVYVHHVWSAYLWILFAFCANRTSQHFTHQKLHQATMLWGVHVT